MSFGRILFVMTDTLDWKWPLWLQTKWAKPAKKGQRKPAKRKKSALLPKRSENKAASAKAGRLKASVSGKGKSGGSSGRSPWQRLVRILMRVAVWAFLLLLLGALIPWAWVELGAAGKVTDDSRELPAVEVGLVLGTSPKLRGGKPNPFFEHRMDAAAELFHAGKVERLLVSGDNRDRYYNEVAAMREALEARGVPAKHIEGDAQGLRTLASIQRAQQLYELEKFLIISQHFHAARAVVIARHEGDGEVLAYAAQDVPSWEMRASVLLREVGARARMMLDLYLLNTQSEL